MCYQEKSIYMLVETKRDQNVKVRMHKPMGSRRLLTLHPPHRFWQTEGLDLHLSE